MEIEKEEVKHIISVLEKTQKALKEKNPTELKLLSDSTVHSASIQQDTASITLAILVYTLSKLIERQDYKKIRSWDNFVKKFNSILQLAILALQKNKFSSYENHITLARKALTNISVNLRQYIEEVLRKASINKASKLYEHGLSLEQTSKLLGVTQWELLEYAGQKNASDNQQESISVEKRATTALEFFTK